MHTHPAKAALVICPNLFSNGKNGLGTIEFGIVCEIELRAVRTVAIVDADIVNAKVFEFNPNTEIVIVIVIVFVIVIVS